MMIAHCRMMMAILAAIQWSSYVHNHEIVEVMNVVDVSSPIALYIPSHECYDDGDDLSELTSLFWLLLLMMMKTRWKRKLKNENNKQIGLLFAQIAAVAFESIDARHHPISIPQNRGCQKGTGLGVEYAVI
jgi:hypothetical protein